MGQDGIYLQVVSRDPSEPQQKNAKRVYDLLMKGKHWVLVTLLLANVIVNESLPVVLDRCLGGGVAAVIGSTILIGQYPPRTPMAACKWAKTDVPLQSSSARSSHNPFAYDTASKSAATCRSPSSFSCTSLHLSLGPWRSS